MYLIGSKLLGLSNYKDTDYLKIVDGENVKYKTYTNEIEIFHNSMDRLNNILKFKFKDWNDIKYQMFNYQYDTNLRTKFGHNDLPFEYNLLDYKKELQEFLDYVKENKLWNYDTKIHGKNNHISIIIYHIAYNKFILKNNSTILTLEQQEIIQKIHDKQMTWEEYIEKVGY